MSASPEVTYVDLYEEVTVDIDQLEEDPDNVRLENNPETVEGLSRALEFFGRYDVAPRVWRTPDGKFRALAGSGRVRGAKKARQRNRDLHAIPVIEIAPPKDRREKIMQQFSENALRDPLGPVDYGRGFKMLAGEGLSYTQILNELRSRGILTQNRTKAWVSQMIQLTELDPKVQVMVNRGDIGVWQGLQLAQLAPADQRLAAERAARENLSRADLRLMVEGSAAPEVLLQETRDQIQERAAALAASSDKPSRKGEKERRNSAVVRDWTLPSVHTAPSQSKLASLQKLDWYGEAEPQERELALEAVAGGHSPSIAVQLVEQALTQASGASSAMRALLISLGQLQQQLDDLAFERSTAPAEFARLRLKSVLHALQLPR